MSRRWKPTTQQRHFTERRTPKLRRPSPWPGETLMEPVRSRRGRDGTIAWAECGNYVIIDHEKNDAVFFFDHELPDELTELAQTFEGFLDQLRPFDIKTIELKPGQVKKVWVDSEFLRKLNRPK